MNTPGDSNPDRIDVNDQAACEAWARRLNVTHEKLREAVGAVGEDPRTVEKHLRDLYRKREQDTDGHAM